MLRENTETSKGCQADVLVSVGKGVCLLQNHVAVELETGHHAIVLYEHAASMAHAILELTLVFLARIKLNMQEW